VQNLIFQDITVPHFHKEVRSWLDEILPVYGFGREALWNVTPYIIRPHCKEFSLLGYN